jgi:hypothetical protein
VNVARDIDDDKGAAVAARQHVTRFLQRVNEGLRGI